MYNELVAFIRHPKGWHLSCNLSCKGVNHAVQLPSSNSTPSGTRTQASDASAPDAHLRRSMRLHVATSSLLAPVHAGTVRLLPPASSTAGTVAVYSLAPLPELLQRVRMAAVHTAVPHIHAEPACTGTLPSSCSFRPKAEVVTCRTTTTNQ